jgi:hypothetical protein
MQNMSAVRRVSIILLSVVSLFILLVGVGLKTLDDEESTELRSVVVRAKIIDDQRYRINSEYKIQFKYNGVYYTNSLQANHNIFKLGDSLDIKIDSRSPLEYCELIN